MASFAPILVIGAGKMGGAILSAWLNADETTVDENSAEGSEHNAGLDPSQLYVEDPTPPPEIIDLLSKYDVVAQSRAQMDEKPQLVMVGVKPQVMEPVLAGLAPRIAPYTLVLSIAAGQTLEDLARPLPVGTPIVRAMPNTPVMVEAGMTALIANEHVSDIQKQKLDALLSNTGAVVWLSSEQQMDGVTAVSGSGPAYLFLLAECLAKAGVKAGLDEKLAMTLAKNTIFGAGKLMTCSDVPPDQLRQNVTSKGGTTAAALDVFMADDGLAQIVDRAVLAAAKRSKELSG